MNIPQDNKTTMAAFANDTTTMTTGDITIEDATNKFQVPLTRS